MAKAAGNDEPESVAGSHWRGQRGHNIVYDVMNKHTQRIGVCNLLQKMKDAVVVTSLDAVVLTDRALVSRGTEQF